MLTEASHKNILSHLILCHNCKNVLQLKIDFNADIASFVTCEACQSKCFFHVHTDTSNQMYFETINSELTYIPENILSSKKHYAKFYTQASNSMLNNYNNTFQTSQKSTMRTDNKALDLKGMIEDSLNNLPKAKKTQVKNISHQQLFQDLIVTKNNQTIPFQTISQLQSAIYQKQISTNDMLTFQNISAPIIKHPNTKHLFVSHKKFQKDSSPNQTQKNQIKKQTRKTKNSQSSITTFWQSTSLSFKIIIIVSAVLLSIMLFLNVF